MTPEHQRLCDHKFIDSMNCLKCGVSKAALMAGDARQHGGAGGGDEDGYNMATGTPSHRDVRNWAKAAEAHGELSPVLARQLLAYVNQQEQSEHPKKPSDFKPRFAKFEPVYVENKPGGVCHVKDIDETAPGVYRYLVERTETFFAHEQALAKMPVSKP